MLAVVLLSLAVLAVALLKAYRAGKALAREVSRATALVDDVSDQLVIERPAVAAAPLSPDELRAREAALLEREAALARREAQLTGSPGGRRARARF